MPAQIENEIIPPFGGLFSRIVIAAAVISFLVLGLITILVSAYLETASTRQVQQRMERSIAVLAPVIDGAFDRGQVSAGKQILANLYDEEGVVCLDYKGPSSGVLDIPTVIQMPKGGCASINEPEISFVDVAIQSSSQGGYHFYIDKRFFLDDRNEALWRMIASSVGALLFVFLGLAIVFRRMILRPLLHLKSAMLASKPSKPALAEIFYQDEIGAVARTYNKLAAASRIYFARLEKSQNNLRASESKFKDMAEISGDWFYEMDDQLRFTYISDRFFELTQLPRDGIIGKSRVEISGERPYDRDWQRHLADLRAHQPFKNYEYGIVTQSGETIIIRINGKPLHDDEGHFIGYRGTGTDVTEITRDKQLLEETNRNFGDSVSYASTIQRGLLPTSDQMQKLFGRTAILWQPKDVVGGDFYWVGQIGAARYLVFFDCTGHGVPGAFMTLITTSILEKITAASPMAISAPQMLELIHKGVCERLGITADKTGKDGLDCAVIKMVLSEGMLEFAGASLDLIMVNDGGEVKRLRGARHSLGYQQSETVREYPKHICPLAGNSFVLMTDGLVTQVGEESKRVLGTRRVLEALEQNQDNVPTRLLRALGLLLKRWQGSQERRDDVTILAFRPYDE